LSAADSLEPREAEPQWFGITLTTWVKITLITGVMFWLFYLPSLRRLWYKTNPIWGEPNWGHAILVPIVGLYYLFVNREELLRTTIVPLLGNRFGAGRLIGGLVFLLGGLLLRLTAPYFLPGDLLGYAQGGFAGIAVLGAFALVFDWGIGLLLFGLATAMFGIHPGKNDWIKDLGMVITIFGTVLTLCGWQVMKIAWFPIVYLVCALPWPGLVYSAIAWPLQKLAAIAAVAALQLTGVDAVRDGSTIEMVGGGSLDVAEGCAGMRSLMTFIALGAAVAFLSNRPLWQRIFMTLSAIPIAILCNVLRVTGQGLLHYYVSQELSNGFAHEFVGLIMLVPALFLILLVGWVLDQLFIEEVDDPKPGTVKVRRRATASSASVVAGEPVATAPRRPGLGSAGPEGH
jgi:exosortase